MPLPQLIVSLNQSISSRNAPRCPEPQLWGPRLLLVGTKLMKSYQSLFLCTDSPEVRCVSMGPTKNKFCADVWLGNSHTSEVWALFLARYGVPSKFMAHLNSQPRWGFWVVRCILEIWVSNCSFYRTYSLSWTSPKGQVGPFTVTALSEHTEH